MTCLTCCCIFRMVWTCIKWYRLWYFWLILDEWTRDAIQTNSWFPQYKTSKFEVGQLNFSIANKCTMDFYTKRQQTLSDDMAVRCLFSSVFLCFGHNLIHNQYKLRYETNMYIGLSRGYFPNYSSVVSMRPVMKWLRESWLWNCELACCRWHFSHRIPHQFPLMQY